MKYNVKLLFKPGNKFEKVSLNVDSKHVGSALVSALKGLDQDFNTVSALVIREQHIPDTKAAGPRALSGLNKSL